MTLKLEKRGLDFRKGEYEWSDCTNHRLFMDYIKTKDGKYVCGEFLHGARYDYSKEKPKLISEDKQLYANLAYSSGEGLKRYEDARKVTDLPYFGKDYTLENILDYVNSFAFDHYDNIEIV